MKTTHYATQTTQPANPVDMPTVTMLYRLADGPVEDTHYGLQLASVVGFPASFMETANRVADGLAALAAQRKRDSEAHRLAEQRKLIFRLHATLVQVEESGMDGGALSSLLIKIQVEFVRHMEAIVGVNAEEPDEAGRAKEGNGTSGLQRENTNYAIMIEDDASEATGGSDEMMD